MYLKWLFGARHMYAEKQPETKVFHYRGEFRWVDLGDFLRPMKNGPLRYFLRRDYQGAVIDLNPVTENEDE